MHNIKRAILTSFKVCNLAALKSIHSVAHLSPLSIQAVSFVLYKVQLI